MTDTAALFFLVSAQVLISGYGARRRASMGFGKASLPSLTLPAIVLLLIAWMMFGMGRVTDLGAMAIAALLVALFTLAAVGFAAAAIGYRSSK